MMTSSTFILTSTVFAGAVLFSGTACSAPPPSLADQPAPVTASPGTADPPAPVTASPGTAGPAAVAIRALHSPGAVVDDMRLHELRCTMRTVDGPRGEYLPDAACTPGAIDPAVTQANIDATICKNGYTATIRPPASDTEQFKVTSLSAYGEAAGPTIELDHLISIDLGGTNSASNLWPQPNSAGATGTTNPKDAVENKLKDAVCLRKVTLAAAQAAIASNWVTAVNDLGINSDGR